jgi:hypothetical protein
MLKSLSLCSFGFDKGIALFAIMLLLSIAACKDDNNPDANCDVLTLEADPVGQWYLGDFHVHASGASNDTGGDSSPEAIQERAIAMGLDFLVLTDHSNSTGSDASTTDEDPLLFNQGPEFPYWDLAAQLTLPGQFLMIDGNEISPVAETNSQPTGHIGCIPEDLNTFDRTGAFTDRPKGTVTGGNALQQAKDRGCFTIINHPYAITPWIVYDWSSYNYDAIEIWNGTIGYDPWDIRGRDIWRCDLLNGKNTIAVGGSDNHRVFTDPPGSGLDPALGYPTTAVFASQLTWPSIMEGVKAGKTAIFEGDSRLFIDGYNDKGCREEGNNTRIIRLRGTVDSHLDSTQIVLTRATGCNDPRPDHLIIPQVLEDTLLHQTVYGGANFDLRVNITGLPGVYSAVLLPNEQAHYAALTRAIVIQ